MWRWWQVPPAVKLEVVALESEKPEELAEVVLLFYAKMASDLRLGFGRVLCKTLPLRH
jgi:hypothetical protein